MKTVLSLLSFLIFAPAAMATTLKCSVESDQQITLNVSWDLSTASSTSRSFSFKNTEFNVALLNGETVTIEGTLEKVRVGATGDGKADLTVVTDTLNADIFCLALP